MNQRNNDYYQKNADRLKAQAAAYREANKEKIAEQKKKYRQDNSEALSEYKKQYAEKNVESLRSQRADYHARTSERRRERNLLKFGLTIEAYELMHKEQGGVCKICGNPETSKLRGKVKRLVVDHCHQSGRVRGLLCNRCNRSIGLMRDSPTLLAKAVEYLSNSEV